MPQLTKNQQYTRITFLGLSFMIMFTSYNSLQNIMSKLYDENNYHNLGQTALIFIYTLYGVSVVFASFVVKMMGYKKSLFYSSLGYGLFQATGFLVIADEGIPYWIVWVAVILGSIVCGSCAGVLWVAQGAYTSAVAGNVRQTELFGVFWGLMKCSQISGNLLITFVLGKISTFVYFSVLTILGFCSSVIFFFLPDVSNQEGTQIQKQQTTIKEQIQKVWAITSNKKYLNLNLYFWFSGITVSFYVGFLYKLVQDSIVKEGGQSDEDYSREVNFYQGLVYITLGVSQLTTGMLMRFLENFCELKLAVVGVLLVWVAGFVSFICYFKGSLVLCFLCSCLWGCSQTYMLSNIGVIVSKLFQGKAQAFGASRVTAALGIITMLSASILLSSAPNYFFLTLVLIITTIIICITWDLRYLKIEGVKENASNQLGTQLISYQHDDRNLQARNVQQGNVKEKV